MGIDYVTARTIFLAQYQEKNVEPGRILGLQLSDIAGRASRESGAPAVRYRWSDLWGFYRGCSSRVQLVGLEGFWGSSGQVQQVRPRQTLGLQLWGVAGWASRDSGAPAVGYSRSAVEGLWSCSCRVKNVGSGEGFWAIVCSFSPTALASGPEIGARVLESHVSSTGF